MQMSCVGLGHSGEQISATRSVERVNILGVGVTAVNLPDAIATLESWRDQRRREYACFVTVHGLVTAQRNPLIRKTLNRAGLAAMDGMPLVWFARLAGVANVSRVCGPDMLEAMCEHSVAHGYRHYFYGSSPEVIEQLVSRLSLRFPGLIVAGYRSPPFRPLSAEEDAADVAAINEARPDFVWIGLGMPKQEEWIAAHVGKINAAALLGVGAAFDFHAGTKPRAPQWMQRSGFEWLFRLFSEPRRLAHRYIIDNATFVVRIAQHFVESYRRHW
jgi:N-acetylglucosaminyldiphosphoundecaprenol N-acetyl-beta-D-mannosaminyltransferase